MYSFRSDFIHGAANIPAPIMADPTSPAVGYYFEELEVTAAVAVGVLTASVQDMVRRDWDLVAFENGVAKGKRRSETRG